MKLSSAIDLSVVLLLFLVLSSQGILSQPVAFIPLAIQPEGEPVVINGLAVDTMNNIYVGVSIPNSVAPENVQLAVQVMETGIIARTYNFTYQGNVPLFVPGDLFVDKSGNLYATLQYGGVDSALSTVVQFSASGLQTNFSLTPLTIGQFEAFGQVVDSAGVFIMTLRYAPDSHDVDTVFEGVARVLANGTVLAITNVLPSDGGFFLNLALDQSTGKLFVVNNALEIVVFNSSTLSRLYTINPPAYVTTNPGVPIFSPSFMYIAVDPQGFVYITPIAAGSTAVVKLDPLSGMVLTNYTSSSASSSRGLAVDNAGRVIVAGFGINNQPGLLIFSGHTSLFSSSGSSGPSMTSSTGSSTGVTSTVQFSSSSSYAGRLPATPVTPSILSSQCSFTSPVMSVLGFAVTNTSSILGGNVLSVVAAVVSSPTTSLQVCFHESAGILSVYVGAPTTPTALGVVSTAITSGNLLSLIGGGAVLVSFPTVLAFSGSAITGDPQFVGLRGQSYQVHGIDGAVYNIISEKNTQVNSRFVFLTEGHCPVFNDILDTNCWSHSGSYMGELSFQQVVNNTLHAALIVAGPAKHGFAIVQMDGKKVDVGGSVAFGSFSVAFKKPHLVIVSMQHFEFDLTNSDMFINQALRPTVSLSQLKSHGLLGQTHSAKTYPSSIRYIEGSVDDYAIADNDIFGTSFVFNSFLP